MKKRIVTLLFLLVFPSLLLAQASRSADLQANNEWKKFYPEFRKALNNRDIVALKSMLPSRFYTEVDGDYSKQGWIDYLDKMKLWDSVKKTAAASTKPNPNNGRPSRITIPRKDCALIFEFGKDGRWRWVRLLSE